MPGTAKGLGVDVYNADANVQGGIKFDAWLACFWARVTEAQERRDLVWAAYNAGPGSLQAAVKVKPSVAAMRGSVKGSTI